jgi:hypothetical protein
VLIETAKELFDRLYKRRILIRLIGVKLSHLVGGVQQLDLFEDSPEMVRLYLTMDRLRNRYGKRAVHRAVGLSSREEQEDEKMPGGPLPGEIEQPDGWQHGGATFKRLWKISRPDYLKGMKA